MTIYADGSPCPVCHRKYCHLDGCTVVFLHAELNAAIKRSGVSRVKITEVASVPEKSASEQ